MTKKKLLVSVCVVTALILFVSVYDSLMSQEIKPVIHGPRDVSDNHMLKETLKSEISNNNNLFKFN